ncbi:Uncharacterised protein [Legionella wadsworthii]|uniref:Uncharacterized protein n=1 Tax=Legionella wadsworthii TaxID=28088 RepID=A0A378LNB5_9GAMM|nr:hypothetical protein [Legionella wadsworthii]STY28244.1 Uncharacterised protein [Legionella wadsworthii]
MAKITVTEAEQVLVLLDTENIRLSDISEYFKKLSQYNKLDEALELLSNLNGKEDWRAAILFNGLKKKKEEAEEPEFNILLEKCNEFEIAYLSNSQQIMNMEGYRCYRVGADAGAGFKAGDLDILGTEGLLECTGVLITLKDSEGTACYYVGHLFSNRTTRLEVTEELNRILSDIQKLTNRKLKWSALAGQVTLIGPGSSTEPPSLCFRQTFKLLTQEGAKPVPLFGSSVAFNLTGKGDSIVLNPIGQLNQGSQSRAPRIAHGDFSPLKETSYLEMAPDKQLLEDNPEWLAQDFFLKI